MRSNAQALFAGGPAESLRRRLKFASLLSESVFMQPGIFRMSAGPGGSFSVIESSDKSEAIRFETAVRRGIAAKRGFVVSISRSDLEAKAFGPQPFIASSESITWNSSLEPFGREFSRDCDWVEWGSARSAETPRRTSVLNRLPILLPDVARMSWEEIANARRHPGIVRLRRELEGIEELVIEAGGADHEGAVRREVDRRIRAVALNTDSALGAAGRVAVGTLIGFGVGLPFLGLAGLGGAALSSLAGGAVEGGRAVRERRRTKKDRTWIALLHQLDMDSGA